MMQAPMSAEFTNVPRFRMIRSKPNVRSSWRTDLVEVSVRGDFVKFIPT